MTPDSSRDSLSGIEATWTGWHFLGSDKRLRRGNNVRPGKLVFEGQTLTLAPKRPLELCAWGYHASKRAIDALTYSPGPVVCRVELLGERLDDDDKSCARSRRCLWLADASDVLRSFGLWCIEDVLRREGDAGRATPEIVARRVRNARELIEASASSARAWHAGETDAVILAQWRGQEGVEATGQKDNQIVVQWQIRHGIEHPPYAFSADYEHNKMLWRVWDATSRPQSPVHMARTASYLFQSTYAPSAAGGYNDQLSANGNLSNVGTEIADEKLTEMLLQLAPANTK